MYQYNNHNLDFKMAWKKTSHQYSEKTKDSAGIPGPWGVTGLTVSSSFGPNFPHRTCHRQCSEHCYTSLFSDGVTNYTWLSTCLGPSRPARKGQISLVPRNLEAGRERKKKSVWFVWLVDRIFRAWEWGKREQIHDLLSRREWLLAL